MSRIPILYRAYAQSGELLYIGRSIRGVSRLREHEKDSPWFKDTWRIQIEEVGDLSDIELAELERQAIRAENPLCNVRDRPPRVNVPKVLAAPDDQASDIDDDDCQEPDLHDDDDEVHDETVAQLVITGGGEGMVRFDPGFEQANFVTVLDMLTDWIYELEAAYDRADSGSQP